MRQLARRISALAAAVAVAFAFSVLLVSPMLDEARGGEPSPTPTPSPYPSPSPKPTPTPYPSPTPTPEPSPTPTPPPPPPNCGDFVTGGGWFVFPNGRATRVNFGFNAGTRGGSPGPKGHVNVVDHQDTNFHIKGTDVTTYACDTADPEHCRRFSGTAEFDGQTGTYDALVCDYGEPGRNDRFRITLNGVTYEADNFDGTPAPQGGELDGGNIQLHGRCLCS